MKKFKIILFFLFLSLCAFGQSRTYEGPNLRVSYLGWQNQRHYLVLNNLQRCPATIAVNWDGSRDTVFLIGLIHVLRLPSSKLWDTTVKLRTIDYCNTTEIRDTTWLVVPIFDKKYSNH